MMYKRKIYDKFLEWKEQDDGNTALLVQGARRVGKSTIVEEFAKNEYESYILVDFGICSKEIKALFEDISDLNYIFMRLQMEYKVELKERKSLIIFDEVQKQPLARQAIKYLVKDHRYDYIETGSLLSVNKNVKDIIIPSEEADINMYPMDYEEFKWALGDAVSIPMLSQCFSSKRGMGDDANRKLMRDFRLYMLIGGMPQAVNEYIESNNMARVDRVKRNIIRLYEKDFNIIDPSGTAARMFHEIPAALNSNANRYISRSATEGKRGLSMGDITTAMKDSMTINMAFHANSPSPGIALHQDLSKYKMYIADTGLFVTLAFWDKDFTENTIYQKLLNDKLGADLGNVYENVVAQMLVAAGHRLYYYTFPTDSGKHNYEVDFIIADGDKVSPIEVKSSGYKAHASLDAFYNKFSQVIKNKFLLYTKDLRKDGDVMYIPVYDTMFL